MEPADPTLVTIMALAAAYGMVVLGMGKRKLIWRRKCRVCGGPRDLCHCRRPSF
ncbi:MAG: hypothetical protein WD981_02610 [Gaiellaceae bacterium]